MTFKATVSRVWKSLSLLCLLTIACCNFEFADRIAHGQDSKAIDPKLDEQEDVRLEKEGYHPEKIQQLSQSTKLKRLRIVNANISDEELLLIGKIAQLELLDLSGCNQITDAGVSHLAKLSKLKNLSLGSPSITDASLETICQLPALAAVTLQGCTINGPGLIHLGKLTRLKEFGLINSMAGDLAMKSLSPGEIVKLKMRSSGITQSGLKGNLPRFPKLKSLDLGENQIDDTSIPLLAGTKIEDLNLLRTLVTSNGVSLLSELPLIRLNLDDIKGIDDSVIPHVLKMERLEFLHLGKTMVTDSGLSQIKGLKSLKDLIINNTAVSETALSELQSARPELRIKH
jgi:internalin A